MEPDLRKIDLNSESNYFELRYRAVLYSTKLMLD